MEGDTFYMLLFEIGVNNTRGWRDWLIREWTQHLHG